MRSEMEGIYRVGPGIDMGQFTAGLEGVSLAVACPERGWLRRSRAQERRRNGRRVGEDAFAQGNRCQTMAEAGIESFCQLRGSRCVGPCCWWRLGRNPSTRNTIFGF